jgi:hypothetical protein
MEILTLRTIVVLCYWKKKQIEKGVGVIMYYITDEAKDYVLSKLTLSKTIAGNIFASSAFADSARAGVVDKENFVTKAVKIQNEKFTLMEVYIGDVTANEVFSKLKYDENYQLIYYKSGDKQKWIGENTLAKLIR